eukprot:5542812-Prymnesium_polylepis.1
MASSSASPKLPDEVLREDAYRGERQRVTARLQHELDEHLASGASPRRGARSERPLILLLGLVTSPNEASRRAYSRRPLAWSEH